MLNILYFKLDTIMFVNLYLFNLSKYNVCITFIEKRALIIVLNNRYTEILISINTKCQIKKK